MKVAVAGKGGVGKTTVSCSILTAIKRKNPLCLINVNPYFLKVSW